MTRTAHRSLSRLLVLAALGAAVMTPRVANAESPSTARLAAAPHAQAAAVATVR